MTRPLPMQGATSSSRASTAMAQARKKLAGATTRLIEMRITRKKWHEPEGERNERAARDVLLIGLCTLSLCAPRLREEDERSKGEREGEKRRKGVGLRANITYILRHVRFVHVALFWTPAAYPETGLKRRSVEKNINYASFSIFSRSL